jgi:hypothetical protein
MGVLDDAIREHLELKRRHGADASEVARQEQEALGPARRGPEPLEVNTPAAGAQPAYHEPEHEPVLEEHAPEIDPEPAWEPAPFEDAHAPQAAAAEVELEDEPELYREPEPAAYEPVVEPEPAFEPLPEPPRQAAVEPEAAPAAPPAPPAPAPREPETAREPEPPPSTVDQPTVAFDVHEVQEALRRDPAPGPAEPAAAPAADGEEDVLEETPDFLQETPEHDRLWFEQRPPRDFDFDG